MNSHLLVIDMALALIRLMAKLRISFSEVKAMYDEAEANGTEVTQEQREELAERARNAIDWL